MIDIIKKILILILVSVITAPLYAEGDSVYVKPAGSSIRLNSFPNNELQKNPPAIFLKREEVYLSFADWLNEKPYPIRLSEEDEKEKIRQDWKDAFGIDVFSPYFKVEEVKEKVEEKSTVKVKKIRGKARIKEDEAKYIFSIKF